MNVTKKNGTKEPIDFSKIHKHASYACEDLEGVSLSQLELNATIQFSEGIETSHIQDILIQSALSLLEEHPNYTIVAGRLLLQQIRRNAYGKGWKVPTISEHIEKYIGTGIYSDSLLLYTSDELTKLQSVINFKLEEGMSYPSLKTYSDKYLTKDKQALDLYETPQMANMLRFMAAFVNTKDRLDKVCTIYRLYNEDKFSLPSPTMKSMRTNNKQYNSCALLKCDDSLNSFDSINGSILTLSSKMYGLGLDGSAIRRLGSSVRNGEIEHTGAINFIKMFESTLNSCSQGGMRKGSMTYYYPIWHYDVKDFIMLRDHGGTDETRCRTLMYAVQNHGLFWKAFINNEDISLFCPKDVPDMYEAFFNDPEKFEQLYNMYSEDTSITKRKINAVELFTMIATQAYQTGKVFMVNVDLMNTQTPFSDTIYSSNLCVAGNTNILTKDGYVEIDKLTNTDVECWNGKEWSLTNIQQTGHNKRLVTVELDNLTTINCTNEHIWHVMDGYTKSITKSTSELTIGDKLIKYSLSPVTQGNKTLELAYDNGFFSGDGTITSTNTIRVDIWDSKHNSIPRFSDYYQINKISDRHSSVCYKRNILKDKFFVPSSNYNLKSRLNWLEGILDSDGTLTNNQGAQSIQLASINVEFLKNIYNLLQELGIHSNITQIEDERMCLMPDGKGDKKLYPCKPLYRLLIAGIGCNLLLDLGYNAVRVQPLYHSYNRSSIAYTKVISITDNNIIGDTFCGREPLNSTLMFNGVLTGNCMEISLPTKPLIQGKNDPDGLISLCTLSAVNWSAHTEPKELELTMNLLVEFMNESLHSQPAYLKPAENSNKWFAPLGIGITNFSHFMAKNGFKYGDPEALSTVHSWMEATYYYALKGSMDYAKHNPDRIPEKIDSIGHANGRYVFEDFKGKYNYPDLCSDWSLKMDWEELTLDIQKHRIANSTVMALMPGETSSIIQNLTNSIEPMSFSKSSKSGNLKYFPPDYLKLKDNYEQIFEVSNSNYLKTACVLQRFNCQAISLNLYFTRDENDEQAIEEILETMLLAYTKGLKTIYYTKNKGNKDSYYELEQTEDDCENCKL